MSDYRSYHQETLRQAAWVKSHRGTLLKALNRDLTGEARQRINHVLQSLEMGHIVVPEELEWVLTESLKALGQLSE